MKKQYDVVVIGAGSGGLTAAVGFSKAGKKVLLVEKEHMGGECTNSGCVPSKALLHRAKEYSAAKQLAGETSDSETYRTQSLTYVRSTVQHFLSHETPETFEAMGIDVALGEAIFRTKCSVAVGETVYEYKTAVIATGSQPRMLNVPGLSETDILTNQNIFDLQNIPAKTLVIGAGPIGLELGQALALLGSQVTIATIDSEFAHLEDETIRPILNKKFTELGITILLQAHIKRVEGQTAVFDIHDDSGVSHEETSTFDKVLVAIGRTPNLPTDLEKAGIIFDEQCILVDSQSRTSNKYVYALGDVAQKLKFTHTADDVARQVVKRVVSKGLLRVNKQKAVPKVTYTLPEVGQVGLSWSEAVAKYSTQRVVRIEVSFSENDRANTENDADGKLVVIARKVNGAVLGAHIIGPAAGEIINIFTLAIDEKISLWKLQKLIFAYPTYSLIVRKAADKFVAQQLTNLTSDILAILKRNAPKFIAGFFWAILLFSFQYYRLSNELSYQDMIFSLLDFFTSTLWGPIVYMTLYAVRPLILFPATLLTALSGALFGFWWGVLYTIIGENASANFAYWIGRFFGKDLRLEDSAIGNFVEGLRKRSFETVLLMRLFYVPFDLTNYGSGIVNAKWRAYFFATLIGIMPGLTTFVALGAAVDLEKFKMDGLTFDAFDPRYLALSIVIFIVSLGLSRILRKWKAEM
jgi:pyruvate/2-oxoglutarate dehydrogenase complex dihydrolipoamide dehydrogenase (E3) component/uncharacterized membrane protein YdjX (TVP38/TMEM64 family)